MEKQNEIVVVCVCRGERPYIREFVEYHLSLGFDRIIIGDNNDRGDTSLYQQLSDLVGRGMVSLYPLHGQDGVQKEFYNDIIRTVQYRWAAFIDVDEFLTFADDAPFNNIREFLSSNPNVVGYKVNWMLYGDNDKVYFENGSVIERFPEHLPTGITTEGEIPDNSHVKVIIRGDERNARFIYSPHVADGLSCLYHSPSGETLDASPFNADIDFKVLYLRHYYTKTIEEWTRFKMGRGYADCKYVPGKQYYPLDKFFRYNRHTPEKDEWLKRNGYDVEVKVKNK